MTTPSNSFVSVVAIVSGDADSVVAFATETLRFLKATSSEHELILVDDGSSWPTVVACDRILEENECVRLIRLSRRFGADIAVIAGLDSAIGDVTVVMKVATDPPSRIPDFVAAGDRGADVVIGTTDRRGRSWLRRAAWKAFHWVYRRITGYRLVPGAATMRLFSRRALNALTRIRQKTVNLRLLGCSVGFRTAVVEYEPRVPPQRVSMAATIGEAISILVTHSPAPLRIASYLGCIASLLNVGCVAWVVAANLWKDDVVEGWTTLSLQIAVMFFFLFMTLMVIAEYLAHAFEEVKDCPLYHVAEERCGSTAMTDACKRNLRMTSIDAKECLDDTIPFRRTA